MIILWTPMKFYQTDSIKFMSGQFDNFGKQLLDILDFIKELKEENKCLKEGNRKLIIDMRSLTKKINVLEQNATKIDIIRIPEQKK